LADLARLLPHGERLGVAVSGGADSLALLLLAQVALPGGIEAATVDHGLRAESAAEAEAVAAICAELGVIHERLTVEIATGNLQARARAARYRALAEWSARRGLAAVATAHHADDQAETVLMRLNRGSGVAGLAGVRPAELIEGIQVLRPLLGWRKRELEDLCRAAGLTPARDPSNADPRFDRARMRAALAEAEWLDPAAIARSAEHLRDADQTLDWAAEHEWNSRVTHEPDVLTYRPLAPRAVRLRILARMIAVFGESARGSAVAALLDALESGGGGTLGGALATSKCGVWRVRREPPRAPR
jgi:tRNA(Ile)-lysidine synthase